MHKLKSFVPQPIKNIYHLCQAILANVWYGFPSRKIKVIGVTGTNGKTTTVQMIAKILEEADKKTAVASTINFKINGEEEINRTKFTTLSSFQVQKFIKKAVEKGCEYLVLETSSHSLDQYRVWGVQYKIAVITNVTREHLDYHKDMQSYREAKKKLFKIVSKNNGTMIVNLDMEKPEEYLKYAKDVAFAYSISNDQFSISNEFPMTNKIQNPNVKVIQAENVEFGVAGSRFTVHGQQFRLNLLGKFNIENSLAATCVGLSENISLEKISQALEKIKLVPGRMESVPNDKGLNIIIDYAVTPDSLEKLYELIKNIRGNITCHPELASGSLKEADKTQMLKQVQHDIKNNSKIIAVFGSCGDRDRGKRPLMGGIVSGVADYVIITNEDPYGEDPQQIIDEVASGVKNKIADENFWKISDRREAIIKALQIAKPGDFVVVTGKGAEETMAIGDERIAWNDKKVIQEELQKLV